MGREGMLEGAGWWHWMLWMKISTSREKHIICFLHLGTRESQPYCQSSLEVCCVFRDSTISRLPHWLCLYQQKQQQSFLTPTLGCKGRIYWSHTNLPCFPSSTRALGAMCSPLTHCGCRGDSVGVWYPDQACATRAVLEGCRPKSAAILCS